MTTPSLPRLSFLLAASLSILAGACADPGPATGRAEREIGSNLVSTTYHHCKTGEVVGEKTRGCVVGPPAQWGLVTSCYEVESEACDTSEPIQIRYCAFNNACDVFEFPDVPEWPYEEWLENQQ